VSEFSLLTRELICSLSLHFKLTLDVYYIEKKESVGHKFCAVGKWTYDFCPERLVELENRTSTHGITEGNTSPRKYASLQHMLRINETVLRILKLNHRIREMYDTRYDSVPKCTNFSNNFHVPNDGQRG
jgi:hypothetical protein